MYKSNRLIIHSAARNLIVYDFMVNQSQINSTTSEIISHSNFFHHKLKVNKKLNVKNVILI